MYGDVFLIEREGARPFQAERLALGETSGRNEAWSRGRWVYKVSQRVLLVETPVERGK